MNWNLATYLPEAGACQKNFYTVVVGELVCFFTSNAKCGELFKLFLDYILYQVCAFYEFMNHNCRLLKSSFYTQGI